VTNYTANIFQHFKSLYYLTYQLTLSPDNITQSAINHDTHCLIAQEAGVITYLLAACAITDAIPLWSGYHWLSHWSRRSIVIPCNPCTYLCSSRCVSACVTEQQQHWEWPAACRHQKTATANHSRLDHLIGCCISGRDTAISWLAESPCGRGLCNGRLCSVRCS